MVLEHERGSGEGLRDLGIERMRTKFRRLRPRSREVEPTGIEPVTSCLQSRRGRAETSKYGRLAAAKTALIQSK